MSTLDGYADRIEQLARELGLEYYPVDFELVPQNFMLEIAVYGMPVRMGHWSFGVRYIHQLLHQHMGHSRIFEVMFPGDPCRAYMMDSNSLAENTLVSAHVIGHADFVRRNALFARHMTMAGGRILEQSAARAHRLEEALARHGQPVEPCWTRRWRWSRTSTSTRSCTGRPTRPRQIRDRRPPADGGPSRPRRAAFPEPLSGFARRQEEPPRRRRARRPPGV